VADQCLAHGFRAIKLHAWGDARRDARLCEAIRNNSFYESLIICNPIEVEPGIDANGQIGGPQAPGVGFAVDEAELARRAVVRLE
jgi:L-alanine-DL-glutamate epimerase-like enolase superfamily enzyme